MTQIRKITDKHGVQFFPQTHKSAVIGMEDKQDLLVSGENIKTLNGESLLGSGDLQVTMVTYPVFQIDDDMHLTVSSPDSEALSMFSVNTEGHLEMEL